MHNQLLLTRFRIPVGHFRYFERQDLYVQLEKGLDDPLTLVWAGTGYGKTTLVGHWLQVNTRPFTWISCAKEMNDIGVFLRYLVHGLQRGAPGVLFPKTEALLDSPVSIHQNTLVNAFLEEILLLQTPHILVLDDFHLVSDAMVLEFVRIWWDQTETRILPYLISHDRTFLNEYGMARHGLVNLIQAQDLNLDEAEMGRMAIRCFDRSLSNEDLQKCLDHTEGWIMGFAHWLRLRQHTTEGLRGIDASLDGYLVSRFIRNQPMQIVEILLIGAVFERFSIPMIQYIGQGAEQKADYVAVFNRMLQGSFFIMALDADGHWFRLHHGFQKAILSEMDTVVEGSKRKRILRVGCQWLSIHGYYEEAIDQSLQLSEIDFTTALMEEVAERLSCTDQYVRLGKLMDRLPWSWTGQHPILMMIRANLYQYQGKIGPWRKILIDFERARYPENGPVASVAAYLVFKGLIYIYDRAYSKSEQSFNSGLPLIPPKNEALYTYAIIFKAQTLALQNKFQEGVVLINTALDALSDAQHYSRIRLLVGKILLYMVTGHGPGINAVLPRLRVLCAQNTFFEGLGHFHYFDIVTAYKRNDHQGLSAKFDQLWPLRDKLRPNWFMYIWFYKMLYHLKNHEYTKLASTRAELDDFVGLRNVEMLYRLNGYLKMEIMIQKGDWETAWRLYAENPQEPPVEIRMLRHYFPQITMLKLWAPSSDPRHIEAYFEWFEKLGAMCSADIHRPLYVQLLLCRTLNWASSGEDEKALGVLQQCLELTAGMEDVMIYTEYGPKIGQLLARLKPNKDQRPHYKEVVQALNAFSPIKEISRRTTGLKERDRKILEMVSKGSNNSEIAEAMYLSPESVKKYLYLTFRELGVKNRVKAVIRAKELGWLD
ncbi:helix-turn-helix transcriptional regulator [Sediminicola luteus]|uniref:HTH luxR-type domain-containing protein n=1 Tax=Sediminicola luteus TaxID=319238 RepID=A0A2A4GC28_9FLAO|nr:LuxR C-terminal-related transcriptional regulator [Sediminicola luteus]PCE66157.1 hypothetical protein B7P33_02340 [Sediminicola luteus]